MRGCDGPAPIPLLSWDDGTKVYECPGKLLTQDTAEFFKLYSYCEKFESMPEPGGVLDQPNYFLECVAVVERAISDFRASKEKK